MFYFSLNLSQLWLKYVFKSISFFTKINSNLNKKNKSIVLKIIHRKLSRITMPLWHLAILEIDNKFWFLGGEK